MIDLLDSTVLGLSAVGHGCLGKMLWLAVTIPSMCSDWPRYKNSLSRVEIDFRICSKCGILLDIHLDKKRRFHCTHKSP